MACDLIKYELKTLAKGEHNGTMPLLKGEFQLKSGREFILVAKLQFLFYIIANIKLKFLH